MTAFKKFDPHAFLERERLAPDSTTAGQPLEPDSTTTLATLATLAGQRSENEWDSKQSLVRYWRCDS